MMYNELFCKDKNNFSIFQIIRHHFNLNSVHPQKKWNNLLSSAKVLHLVGVMPPFRALWRLSATFSFKIEKYLRKYCTLTRLHVKST